MPVNEQFHGLGHRQTLLGHHPGEPENRADRAGAQQWRPIRTFSSTVIPRNRRMFWNVRAMPRLVTALGFKPTRFLPLNMTSPSVGAYKPVTTLKAVASSGR